MISILLSIKDSSTLTVLSYHFERCGFIVNSARNIEELSQAVERIEPNILVADEEISDSSSVHELCRILKLRNKTKNVHIILLSKAAIKNVEYVNDFIVKPFVPSELVAKIKNFANTISTNVSRSKVLQYNDIEMQVDSFKVTRSGKQIHLGPTEFKILQCFLELPGKVLSREHIMNHVWGYGSDIEPRTIDVHINRLRVALKEDDDELSIIRTIRSAGYSLNMVRSLVKV